MIGDLVHTIISWFSKVQYWRQYGIALLFVLSGAFVQAQTITITISQPINGQSYSSIESFPVQVSVEISDGAYLPANISVRVERGDGTHYGSIGLSHISDYSSNYIIDIPGEYCLIASVPSSDPAIVSDKICITIFEPPHNEIIYPINEQKFKRGSSIEILSETDAISNGSLWYYYTNTMTPPLANPPGSPWTRIGNQLIDVSEYDKSYLWAIPNTLLVGEYFITMNYNSSYSTSGNESPTNVLAHSNRVLIEIYDPINITLNTPTQGNVNTVTLGQTTLLKATVGGNNANNDKYVSSVTFWVKPEGTEDDQYILIGTGENVIGTSSYETYTAFTDIGSYEVIAKLIDVDAGGNNDQYSGVAIVDVVPPPDNEVILLSPVTNDIYPLGTDIPLEAFVSVYNANITNVEFEYIGISLDAPNGTIDGISLDDETYVGTLSNLPIGSYVFVVHVSLGTGSATLESELAYNVKVVHATPGTLEITSPFNNSQYASPKSDLEVKVTASDPNNGINNVRLSWTDNNGTLHVPLNPLTGSEYPDYTFAIPELTKGNHVFTAISQYFDGVEDVNISSTNVNVKVGQFEITAPADGTRYFGNPFTADNIIVELTSDLNIDESSIVMDWTKDDANQNPLAPINGTSTYIFDTGQLEIGTYTFTATGLTSDDTYVTSNTITIVVSNPSLTLSSPDGLVFPAPADYTLLLDIQGRIEDITSLRLSINGILEDINIVDGQMEYSLSQVGMVAGVYNYQVIAETTFDQDASSNPLQIIVERDDTTDEVILLSPITNGIYPLGTDIPLEAFVDITGITIDRVVFTGVSTQNDIDIYEIDGIYNANDIYIEDFNLPVGVYLIQATAYWTENGIPKSKSSERANNVKVIYDVSGINLLEITSPDDGSTYLSPKSDLVVRATAFDPNSGINGIRNVRLDWTMDGEHKTTLNASGIYPDYTFVIPELTEGNYVFTAISQYNDGAEWVDISSTPVNVKVGYFEITDPIDGMRYLAGADNLTADNIMITLESDFSNLSSLEMVWTIGGTVVQPPLTTTDATPPYYFNAGRLAVGTYTFTATAQTQDGHNLTSNAITIIVSNPTLTLNSPEGLVFAAPADYSLLLDIQGRIEELTSLILYKNNEEEINIDLANPEYTYELPQIEIEVGKYNYYVVGNTKFGSVTSNTVEIVVAEPPHNADLTVDRSEVEVYENYTLSLTTEVGSSPIKEVIFYNEDGIIIGRTSILPYTCTSSQSVAGLYSYYAIVEDINGLTAKSNTVTVAVMNRIPPTVALSVDPNRVVIDNPYTFTVIANAVSGATIRVVELYETGNDQPIATWTNQPYTYIYPGKSTVGKYDYYAVTTDSKDESSISSPVEVNVIEQEFEYDCSTISAYKSGEVYYLDDMVKVGEEVYECQQNGVTNVSPQDNNCEMGCVWRRLGICKPGSNDPSAPDYSDRQKLIVSLFPNPNSGQYLKANLNVQIGEPIYVYIRSLTTTHEVMTFNDIASKTGIEQFVFDISSLPQGQYTVIIKTSTKKQNLTIIRQ